MIPVETETVDLKIDLDQIKKKQVFLVVFGHGNVGEKLIDQLLKVKEEISQRRDIDIEVFAIANSRKIILSNSIENNWREQIKKEGRDYQVQDVIDFATHQGYYHRIAIDNTASADFVTHYPTLIEGGFNLISSNKIGNSSGLESYRALRRSLKTHQKEYLYETNVGAGLPLIDTIKLLHASGEYITRIKGVFSGSLSYIFNEFSKGEYTFSEIVNKAKTKGFTEPDPREDLSGTDVARKLLILARELELHVELEDVSVQNLIPKALRKQSQQEFFKQIQSLDVPFQIKLKNQPTAHVLRYIGDLHGDLSQSDGAKLDVKLVSVPKDSTFGLLSGSDSLFEIYTENYQKHPIVIQGAGAGAEVTARGVLGDILRLCDKL